jgi:hypothetical protein
MTGSVQIAYFPHQFPTVSASEQTTSSVHFFVREISR